LVIAFPVALIGVVSGGAAATASVGACASGAVIAGTAGGRIGEIIDSQRTFIDWKTTLTDK
jgi:hypothetical protein